MAHPDSQYRREASVFLQNEFPRVSCAAIDAVLRSSEYKFADAFHFLTNIESQRGARTDSGAGEFGGIAPHIKVFIKYKRRPRTLRLTHQKLCNEVDAIPELNTKGKGSTTQAAGDEEVAEVLEEGAGGDAKQEPQTECLCCYVEYPLAQMLECSAGSGHLVCHGCINQYVREQVDGNGSCHFRCIVDPDCANAYTDQLLDQDGVLSPRLKDRKNDRMFREMLAQLNMGDGW